MKLWRRCSGGCQPTVVPLFSALLVGEDKFLLLDACPASIADSVSLSALVRDYRLLCCAVTCTNVFPFVRVLIVTAIWCYACVLAAPFLHLQYLDDFSLPKLMVRSL